MLPALLFFTSTLPSNRWEQCKVSGNPQPPECSSINAEIILRISLRMNLYFGSGLDLAPRAVLPLAGHDFSRA